MVRAASVALTATESRLTRCARTLAASLSLTTIVGARIVTDALVTATLKVIASAPALRAAPTAALREPALTLTPRARSARLVAKARPRGSRIVSDLNAGANAPAVTEKLSRGRPRAIPLRWRTLPSCGLPGTTTYE